MIFYGIINATAFLLEGLGLIPKEEAGMREPGMANKHMGKANTL